jgi:ribokinase
MITVFGSINVDLVVQVPNLPGPGETVLGPGYDVTPGGKGANQAVAAARAGAEVRMVGCVGQDGFAEAGLAELRAAGVMLDGVRPDRRPTGCAFISVDRTGQNQIVVAQGANGAVRERQVPDAWLDASTIVVMQMEVPLTENWALVTRACARGARVLLNAAPAAPIPGLALAALDWLVVNETEALILARRLGTEGTDAETAGRTLAHALGITTVVTLGSAGAVAFQRATAWRIGSMQITPVDTVAAGDAFVGTFAAALDKRLDLPDALRRASVAGGLACLKQGAQTSLPDAASIDARLGDLAPAVEIAA